MKWLLQQAKTELRTKIKVKIKENHKVKGRCHHCGKYGHKKVDSRDWLKLTKEGQDKADKEQQEKSEEKPKKNKDHIKCFNCNKRDTMQVNAQKTSQQIPVGGSSGGLCNDVF